MPPKITLKQRLAQLSNAQSSPSPPRLDSSTSLSTSSRKRAFVSPWARRSIDNTVDSERQKVSEVMSKLIFQAGVDFETRPMVVLNASALPDPDDISYDLLLGRALSYLNLYVEADYTVVFFAAGGRHTPGWSWVWKAYRSLSRKYRKNLKKLYIVHSSFFSKMLFSLAGAIISPKFFQKISYIDTLSELALHVPLTQIDLSPAVYQENLKYERTITMPTPTRANIFGVPLEDLMGYDGEKGGVPRVVRDCAQFIRESGMEEDGLFRRSPQSAMLRQAQEAYDRGQVVSLELFADPHLAAVLLKKYLRDLPEPIFPEKLYPTIRRCPPPSTDPIDMTSISYIREHLLPELTPCAYIVLSHVIHLLHEVSLRSASNRMDAHNLAVVVGPNLVKGSNPVRDVAICVVPGGPALFETQTQPNSPASDSEPKTTLGAIIKLCIQRYYEVFDETRDRSEAVYSNYTEEAQDSTATSSTSSLTESPVAVSHPHSDEDEEIDDAMLVMPIAPGHRSHYSIQHNSNVPVAQNRPPSAWNSSSASPTSTKSRFGGYNPRHRNDSSNGSLTGARSANEGSSPSAYSTMSKARSVISIEKEGAGPGRKGSISIGRGTLRKSAGAGVEALGVTAAGFFTPPSDAPPVPSRD